VDVTHMSRASSNQAGVTDGAFEMSNGADDDSKSTLLIRNTLIRNNNGVRNNRNTEMPKASLVAGTRLFGGPHRRWSHSPRIVPDELSRFGSPAVGPYRSETRIFGRERVSRIASKLQSPRTHSVYYYFV